MFSRGAIRLRASAAALMALVLGSVFLSPTPASATSPPGGPRTWHVHVGEQSASGALQGMAFLPGDITINVGDTVHWTADSLEPHTVSFVDASHPLAPFSPAIAYMVAPTTQSSIAPGQFRNSGIMASMSDPALPPARQAYDLKFTAPGDYTYYCYLHGAGMIGRVHVNAAGTRYPLTQQQYDRMFRQGRAAVIADGRALWANARRQANDHHVFVGAADMRALVMRFTRPTVTIRVGETVTFDANLNQVPVPHTVTFGAEPANPGMPVGDPLHYDGVGPLNSGLMFAAPFGIPNVSRDTFPVTFTKAGTYHYICIFHDGMGMSGTVVVRADDDSQDD